MHKFKYQGENRGANSTQKKTDLNSYYHILDKCTHILRDDRIWLRNRLKAQDQAVIYIFKNAAKPLDMHNLQIKLRKFVTAIKAKQKQQKLQKFKQNMALGLINEQSTRCNRKQSRLTENSCKENRYSNHKNQKSYSRLQGTHSTNNIFRDSKSRKESFSNSSSKWNHTLVNPANFNRTLKYLTETMDQRTDRENSSHKKKALREQPRHYNQDLQNRFSAFQQAPKMFTRQPAINRPEYYHQARLSQNEQESQQENEDTYSLEEKPFETVPQRKGEAPKQAVSKISQNQHIQNNEYEHDRRNVSEQSELNSIPQEMEEHQMEKEEQLFTDNFNQRQELPIPVYSNLGDLQNSKHLEHYHQHINFPVKQQEQKVEVSRVPPDYINNRSPSFSMEFTPDPSISSIQASQVKIDESIFTPPDLLAECRNFLKNMASVTPASSNSKDGYTTLPKEVFEPISMQGSILKLSNEKCQNIQNVEPIKAPSVRDYKPNLSIQIQELEVEEHPAIIVKQPTFNRFTEPQLINTQEKQYPLNTANVQLIKSEKFEFIPEKFIDNLIEFCKDQPKIKISDLNKFLKEQPCLAQYTQELVQGNPENKLYLGDIGEYLEHKLPSSYKTKQQNTVWGMYCLLDIQRKGHITMQDIKQFTCQLQKGGVEEIQQYYQGLMTLFDLADYHSEGSIHYWNLYIIKESEQFEQILEMLGQFEFQVQE